MVLRWALLPLVCFAAMCFVMASWVMVTTLHHRAAWLPTTATVTEAGLRPTGLKYGKPFDFAVSVDYVVDGKPLTWTGFGKDIGLYKAVIGGSVALRYNPRDPSMLDTAQMKGWLGGLILLAATGTIVAFYLWFFWLRRPPGAAPPSRPAAASREPRAFGLR